MVNVKLQMSNNLIESQRKVSTLGFTQLYVEGEEFLLF